MNIETLYQAIDINRHSKENAIYFRSTTIDYPTLLKRIDHMADVLYSIGVRKDTTVSLLSPNVPQAVEVLYAMSKIGCRMSFLHPLLPKETLKESLKETESDYLLILDVLFDNYKDIDSLEDMTYFLSVDDDLNPLESFFFSLANRKKRKKLRKDRYLSSIQCDDQHIVANTDGSKGNILLRSGGTTGRSKTVVTTEKGLNFVTQQSEEILCSSPKGKSMIGILPMFHGFGLAMGIHAPLANQAATCLFISYDGKAIVKKIKENKLNILLTIPYMTDKLLSRKDFRGEKLKNLISTFIGADKPEERLFSEFDNRMIEAGSKNRLLEGYGLTETITVNFVNTLNDNRKGSVGKPIRGVEVRICSEDDLSHDLGPNSIGRILIKSESLCLGYLNVKKEEQPFQIDDDGTKWLITGDIGYKDKDGFLFFKNRENDVRKIAGYNIFPSEIESIAEEVHPVRTAKAVYIDDRTHPYIVLFVQAGRIEDKDSFQKHLSTYLKDRLIRYSLPEQIIFLEDFPRTDIGKIDINKLKENWLSGKYKI